MADLVTIVGFNGSQCSLAALKWAISQAKVRHGYTVALIVIELPLDPVGPPPVYPVDDDNQAALRASSLPPMIQSIVETASQAIESAGVAGEVQFAIGDPAQRITEAAKRLRARTVVVGAGRRRRLPILSRRGVSVALRQSANFHLVTVDKDGVVAETGA